MAAETLNCPMCGAAASSDSTCCEHCGARLATVACPSCFGMMFLGAKFCSHCGAKADRQEASTTEPRLCPRCRVNMQAVVIGQTNLLECGRCEGVWADGESLRQICADREMQSAVLGIAAVVPPSEAQEVEVVRYVPCPVCGNLMHRVNFARCSHVILDVCKPHGTWFDKDELRRMVEFIRGGGMEKSRLMEMEEIDRQRRALEAARWSGDRDGAEEMRRKVAQYDDREFGISFAAAVLRKLMK